MLKLNSVSGNKWDIGLVRKKDAEIGPDWMDRRMKFINIVFNKITP